MLPMPYAEEQMRRLTEESLIDAHLYGVDDFITGKLEIADGEFDLEKFKTAIMSSLHPLLTRARGGIMTSAIKSPSISERECKGI